MNVFPDRGGYHQCQHHHKHHDDGCVASIPYRSPERPPLSVNQHRNATAFSSSPSSQCLAIPIPHSKPPFHCKPTAAVRHILTHLPQRLHPLSSTASKSTESDDRVGFRGADADAPATKLEILTSAHPTRIVGFSSLASFIAILYVCLLLGLARIYSVNVQIEPDFSVRVTIFPYGLLISHIIFSSLIALILHTVTILFIPSVIGYPQVPTDEQIWTAILLIAAFLHTLPTADIDAFLLTRFIINSGKLDDPDQILSASRTRFLTTASNTLAAFLFWYMDDLSLYAQATCVQGDTTADIRYALEIQLSKIPQRVRDGVVCAAVIEGMSTTNSVQNSTSGVSKDGTAYSYLAFWSTAYNGDRTIMAPVDSTCIMAAGVTISIGEDIAGFETMSSSRQIGSKPCECGYLFCSGVCPIFEKAETRKPIYKRHRLTLRNQIELHRWMVKQAVDRASSLMGEHRRLPVDDMQVRRDSLSSLAWQPPDSNTFPGSDKAAATEGDDVTTTKDEL